ncbi:SPFH domain-containing protein [Microbacterium sp.]|uniref:SPFH domain-containing protein n=1 Tax=Microbacterium sp. TaxID=51671 RepID=UPI0039E4247F
MSVTDPQPSAVVGGTGVQISERPAWRIDGIVTGLIGLTLVGVAVYLGFTLPETYAALYVAIGVLGALLLTALVIVAPGDAYAVEFFGRYIGTVRRPGMSLVVPFALRKRVSVRVRNFETATIKVNDADGNPVDIAAIVVWQVADTAKAVYAVDDCEQFVHVQAESALRHTATSYPYDSSHEGEQSLRGSTDVVAAELAREVAVRVGLAGVDIVEVRISQLAYAKEIAQTMLRRQQANAVVAARRRIVEGAVGMVELALADLANRDIVDLDDERKAAMVSNLLVVLCSDQPTSPIVNTGTLYPS